MSDAEDIAAIEAAEAKSASMSADGASVTQRSASDRIAFMKFRRQLQASQDASNGIVIRQVVAPGAGR